MAFNGSGVFLRAYNWVQDKANSIPITASRMDAEFDNLAAGLTGAVAKDGQTVGVVLNGVTINGATMTGGNVTVPTATTGDNTTKAASTAFVAASIALISRTGEESFRFSSSTYETGWLLENGQTLGSTSSGATRTGTTFQALFNFLWANGTNTTCPMLTSAGSASTRGA